MGSISIALSALRASGVAIDTIGNNLANLNTTGYKRSEVSFGDLMFGLGTENSTGGGIGRVQTSRVYLGGPLQNTNNPLDAAIRGSGFFMVKKPAVTGGAGQGAMLYTRDGKLQFDSAGYLTTMTGAHIQGWTAGSGGGLSDVQIPLNSRLAPRATTKLSFAANLDASAPSGTTFSVPTQVYDAQGLSHVLNVTFTKGQEPNTWGISVASSDPAIQSAGTPAPATLTFENGLPPASLAGIALGPITFTQASGIAPIPSINWELRQTVAGATTSKPWITQFAQASSSGGVSQDGSSEAVLSGVRIADGGRVVATYSTGKEVDVATIAVGLVRDPEALVAMGDNLYMAPDAAGPEPPVAIGQAAPGEILGSFLEGSNVDLADQFTELITFQRSYQANSRVITTSDELMQEAIGLIR